MPPFSAISPHFVLLALLFVGALIVIRIFWVVIQWEVRFDIRILEFGFHAFLLGMVTAVGLMAWYGYLPAF